jgi:lysophospholipase L1-like esterase
LRKGLLAAGGLRNTWMTDLVHQKGRLGRPFFFAGTRQALLLGGILMLTPFADAAEWIRADDARLRWEGRFATDSSGAARFDWNSVRLHAAFEGPEVDVAAALGANYLDVLVDGRRVAVLGPRGDVAGAAWKGLGVEGRREGEKTVFRVAGLGPGKHRLAVAKRCGPNFGAVRLDGVRFPAGRLLARPATPVRRLECIGDSLTNGYGNEGPDLKCPELAPYENSSLSWDRLCADALDADLQMIAISGFGMVRNYGAAGPASPDPVPWYYPRTLMGEEALEWDRTAFVPDAVFVFLGSNDLSTEPVPSEEAYVGAYHAFLKRVRQGRPAVPIVCVCTDAYPEFVRRVRRVVDEESAQGEPVSYLCFPAAKPGEWGCDYHPLASVHERWAALAVSRLTKLLGWHP